MATNIIMPKMGMDMTEGVVSRWLKADDDWVRQGEAILEVENDKITNEVIAEASGRLRILVAENGICAVGRPVAQLFGEDELASAPTGAAVLVAPTAVLAASQPGGAEAGDGPRVRASPIARRLAREAGLDLAHVQGTGPGGRIVERDIVSLRGQAAEPARVSATPPHRAADATGRLRHQIADRMVRSLQTTAQLTLTGTADVTSLLATREALGRRWTVKPSLTALFVRAAAVALKNHPQLTARWDEGRLNLPEVLDIGVAVALPEGLIVPVVRNAGAMALAELDTRLGDLTERARQRALKADEVGLAGFTLTNLGMYRVEWFTPILNPPESAILGLGQIEDRLVLDRGLVASRARLPLSLTIDHRVVDGAPAAAFLDSLIETLESPALLM